MSETRSVGIVGGGILGMTAAYRLAQAGVRVAVFERAPDLGGLVGSFDFGGRQVDRFYHVVLPTDDRVRDYLAAREALKDQTLPDAERTDLLAAMSEAFREMTKPQRHLIRRVAGDEKQQQWLDESAAAQGRGPQQ